MNFQLYLIKTLGTFFGVGLLPSFQGTVASMISAFLLYWLSLALNFNILVQVIIFILIFAFSLLVVIKYEYKADNKDPSEIVIDEVLGVAVFMIALPLSSNPEIYSILSLLIFRFLDFFKPSVIYRFQIQGTKTAIILDDIMAGLLTLILIISLDINGIV